MKPTVLASVGHGQTRPAPLPLDLAAALGGGAADDVVPLVQHPLQLGGRLGRVGGYFGGELHRRLLGAGGAGGGGGSFGGELPRRLLGAGGGRDAVDEPQPQRLVGADRATAEQQVL